MQQPICTINIQITCYGFGIFFISLQIAIHIAFKFDIKRHYLRFTVKIQGFDDVFYYDETDATGDLNN